MKQTIAVSLALVLVAASVPALAHEANYPGECDDRKNDDRCERHDETKPAHDKCTGVRNHMWAGNALVQRPIGFAISEDASIEAYLHAQDEEQDNGQENGDDGLSLMPGVIWLETNGFDGLQRTDFECQSGGHENPDGWETHADTVLI